MLLHIPPELDPWKQRGSCFELPPLRHNPIPHPRCELCVFLPTHLIRPRLAPARAAGDHLAAPLAAARLGTADLGGAGFSIPRARARRGAGTARRGNRGPCSRALRRAGHLGIGLDTQMHTNCCLGLFMGQVSQWRVAERRNVRNHPKSEFRRR